MIKKTNESNSIELNDMTSVVLRNFAIAGMLIQFLLPLYVTDALPWNAVTLAGSIWTMENLPIGIAIVTISAISIILSSRVIYVYNPYNIKNKRLSNSCFYDCLLRVLPLIYSFIGTVLVYFLMHAVLLGIPQIGSIVAVFYLGSFLIASLFLIDLGVQRQRYNY